MHGFKTEPYVFYSCSIVHNVWPCYRIKRKKGYNPVTHKCLALVCNGIGFMYFSIFTSLISLVFSTFKQPYNLLRSLTWKVGTNQADVDEHGNMTADVVVEQVIVRILMK